MLSDFFGDVAIARSNYSLPSRLFLDPYHVSDGVRPTAGWGGGRKGAGGSWQRGIPAIQVGRSIRTT